MMNQHTSEDVLLIWLNSNLIIDNEAFEQNWNFPLSYFNEHFNMDCVERVKIFVCGGAVVG